jgi:hypothetical protein
MLVRRQWNASHIAEKSGFRTSAPWLNCCQQANALIELGRRTKISPQKRACDGRFDSSPRADFTDVPKRVSPTADVEICLPRNRFRTSLHKRLAAVERGEVSVQFPPTRVAFRRSHAAPRALWRDGSHPLRELRTSILFSHYSSENSILWK